MVKQSISSQFFNWVDGVDFVVNSGMPQCVQPLWNFTLAFVGGIYHPNVTPAGRCAYFGTIRLIVDCVFQQYIFKT
jgi:hypothetical protein